MQFWSAVLPLTVGADELDVGRQGGNHEGDRVIGAGVDVEDDSGRHGVGHSWGTSAGDGTGPWTDGGRVPDHGVTAAGGCRRVGSGLRSG